MLNLFDRTWVETAPDHLLVLICDCSVSFVQVGSMLFDIVTHGLVNFLVSKIVIVHLTMFQVANSFFLVLSLLVSQELIVPTVDFSNTGWRAVAGLSPPCRTSSIIFTTSVICSVLSHTVELHVLRIHSISRCPSFAINDNTSSHFIIVHDFNIVVHVRVGPSMTVNSVCDYVTQVLSPLDNSVNKS